MDFTGVELASDAELAARVEKAATDLTRAVTAAVERSSVRWRRPWRTKGAEKMEEGKRSQRARGAMEMEEGGRPPSGTAEMPADGHSDVVENAEVA